LKLPKPGYKLRRIWMTPEEVDRLVEAVETAKAFFRKPSQVGAR